MPRTTTGFTPQEHRISALPSAIASMAVIAVTVFNGSVIWPQSRLNSILLLMVGSLGLIYLFIFDLFLIPSPNFKPALSWFNALAVSSGMALLTFLTTTRFDLYIAVLIILATITSSIISDRGPSYLIIFLSTVLILGIRYQYLASMQELIFHLSIVIISGIVVETVRQLKNLSRDRIRKLETITEFSRQIGSTLETKQVFNLLNAAIQSAVEADTYFVGIREGDELRLELIFDDGEYYENQRVKLEGSLSGWVVENQRSLFLPDLRREVTLPKVRLVLVGKHKTSLSWMGVPMRGRSVDGIIAIGSYRPNDFDRADLELLSNLAQHGALALDNTYRHAQVELQAQLDSLTGVYNHGSFLKILGEQADQSRKEQTPLGLIMLDIDYFKHFNDTYGHLVGDEILTSLCKAIKQHVKSTDAVGRWGGEEFAISLPNANAEQSQVIAGRIRETLASVVLGNPDKETIKPPTISQGIAIFPGEAEDVIKLIDLADRRLYIAKSRGRNQIEPEPV